MRSSRRLRRAKRQRSREVTGFLLQWALGALAALGVYFVADYIAKEYGKEIKQTFSEVIDG